jgi:hypothetical protein
MATGAAQAPGSESADPTLDGSIADPRAPGNIDKIRDILFGAQIKEYHRQFVRLESRIATETENLRAEIARRSDTLENFIRNEIQILGERLTAERDDRKTAIHSLTTQLSESAEGAERRRAQLQDQTAETDRAIRHQLLELSTTVSEQVRQKHQELLTIVEDRFHELRQSKTDRAALAGILGEMSIRINAELALLDGEGPPE